MVIENSLSRKRGADESAVKRSSLAKDFEPKIGSRLRHSRMVLGLSLRDVARMADVTEGYVSKIENDKVKPSFATLHRIANAVDTNISALFSQPENTGRLVAVIPVSDRPVMKFGNSRDGDGIRLERLSPIYPGSLLQANIHVVEPGGGSDEAISHRGQELGMVLEGTLDLYVGDEVHRLETGDAFSFDSGHEHRYVNTGDHVTRVIWVNSPPTF